MCPPVIVRAGSGQAKAAFCHGPFYYFSLLPPGLVAPVVASSSLDEEHRPCGKEIPRPVVSLGDNLVCQFNRSDDRTRDTLIYRRLGGNFLSSIFHFISFFVLQMV